MFKNFNSNSKQKITFNVPIFRPIKTAKRDDVLCHADV